MKKANGISIAVMGKLNQKIIDIISVIGAKSFFQMAYNYTIYAILHDINRLQIVTN